MRLLISRLISLIKGEEYKIASNIDLSYLVVYLLGRTLLLSRGVLFNGKIIFRNVGVRLKSRNYLRLGRFVTIGRYVYIDSYSKNGVSIGDNVNIGDFSIWKSTGVLSDLGEGITIENNVGIGSHSYLGGYGGITIKRNTIVGQNFTVHSDNHIYTDEKTLIRLQGTVKLPVEIGSNCWIGSNVTILGGVKVGSNCVIGAGAVVTKSFPDGSILYGVPAKARKKHEE